MVLKPYHSYHVALLSKLDSARVSYATTIKYIEEHFGTKQIDALNNKQCIQTQRAIRKQMIFEPEDIVWRRLDRNTTI